MEQRQSDYEWMIQAEAWIRSNFTDFEREIFNRALFLILVACLIVVAWVLSDYFKNKDEGEDDED